MTFVIQGTGLTALGSAGGGLGYNGIVKSVAIDFDLFNNDSEGINSTGLRSGGNPGIVKNLNGTGIDLHSGHIFTAAMSYDGTTLQVTLTDTVTKATATQSYAVNIPALVGGNSAYVGFTGGTGGLTAVQKILNWTYSATTSSSLAVAAIDRSAASAASSFSPSKPSATSASIISTARLSNETGLVENLYLRRWTGAIDMAHAASDSWWRFDDVSWTTTECVGRKQSSQTLLKDLIRLRSPASVALAENGSHRTRAR